MRSLLLSAVCCACLARLGGGQQLEDLDQSPDYSTIFQQFLLQKIREGEAWSSFDYEEAELPDRARNDVEEDVAASTQISGDEEVTTEPAAEEEAVVVNTAPYQLTSAGGGAQLSGSVRLLQVAGSPSLVLAASLAAAATDLFRDQSCVPGLYLVRDQRDCAQLPQEFEAKQLASIHGPGEAEVRVDATWSELPGRCLAVLRPRRCEAESEEQSGDGEAAVLDIGTEDAEDAAEYRAEASGDSVVRASLGRSYSSLSLTSFSLLSASSASGVFTVTKPSLGLTGSVPGAVVATKYDRFSTLPYLQLSGWTAADAFLLVLLMMGAYLTYGYLTASLVSVEPLRRRIFNEAQLARVDALNDGLSLILETYLMSLANPWKKIATNIDRNLLLRRRKSSKNKFVSRVDLDVNDPLRGY